MVTAIVALVQIRVLCGDVSQCHSGGRLACVSGRLEQQQLMAETASRQRRFASVFELPRRIGDVDTAQHGRLPSPQEFHEHAGRPLLLRGLAAAMPAAHSFADVQTMAQRLGQSKLSVEVGPKLENRRYEAAKMTMDEFLRAELNNTEEASHYIVSSLSARGVSSLASELLLPSVLRCGGATEEPLQLSLWVSAGGTLSVLHADALDNLNCVFAGRKRFWITDSVYNKSFQRDTCGWTVSELLARAAGDDSNVLGADEVRRRHGYGAFAGNVDVRKIDLDTAKGACWSELPWWDADVGPGDCLYIPKNFLHHVHTPPGRSVAVSCWYERPEEFDAAVGFGCDDTTPLRMSRGFL